ncbi:MAG: Uma2 family endonuclease [Candidatus Rokubacteria bacterium]|nr:Uma2 family endonuclease [Candidatus Rokubacteria bacterium]
MAIGLKRKLGYVDFERLPSNDGKRYEILDGELYVTPAPTPWHQRLSKRLLRRLEDYFEARGLGEAFHAPIDVYLSQYDFVEPDLVVVADPAQITDKAIVRAPLLVVEILSPSSRAQDRGIKMRRYADLGVAHYWIVDPDAERIECRRLAGRDYGLVTEASTPDTLTHPDWPELVIDLAEVWRST